MNTDQGRQYPGGRPPAGHVPAPSGPVPLPAPQGWTPGAENPYGPNAGTGPVPPPYPPHSYPPPPYPPPAYPPYGHAPPDRTVPVVVYVLLLLSYVLAPFTPIAALITAYINRSGGDWVADTHYTYAIRTFWVGCLYLVVGAVLSFVLVGIPILIFLAVWWLVRCIKGLSLLNQGQPVPDPNTWLW